MSQFKLLLILSTCITKGLLQQSGYYELRYNNLASPSDSYIGPSSYATSFGSDYPGHGNYGPMLNMKNPEISSSYSSFGPSADDDEFRSTNYFNYPLVPDQKIAKYQGSSSYTTPQEWPLKYLPPSTQEVQPSYGEETPISQHVEITKPIAVPVYKKFPYPVAKKFPVAIPHPVLVPVPAPYPVNVEVSQPVAVPVIREIKVPIEKEVLYPVEKQVMVPVDKPVKYHVEKHYPVYVPRPYPVKVPIVKTIIHKAPRKW